MSPPLRLLQCLPSHQAAAQQKMAAYSAQTAPLAMTTNMSAVGRMQIPISLMSSDTRLQRLVRPSAMLKTLDLDQSHAWVLCGTPQQLSTIVGLLRVSIALWMMLPRLRSCLYPTHPVVTQPRPQPRRQQLTLGLQAQGHGPDLGATTVPASGLPVAAGRRGPLVGALSTRTTVHPIPSHPSTPRPL